MSRRGPGGGATPGAPGRGGAATGPRADARPASAPAAAATTGPRGLTVFLHGALAATEERAEWLAALEPRPAAVAGRLWRGGGREGVLVPEGGVGVVGGVCVEVDAGRVAVLELLAQGPHQERMEVEARVGLRLVRALTWGIPSASRAFHLGYRPSPRPSR